jgi:hypothetical protein
MILEPSGLAIHAQQADDKDRKPNQKADNTCFLYEVRHRGKSETPEGQEEANQQNQTYKGYPSARSLHAYATVRARHSWHQTESSAPCALGRKEGFLALGAEPSAGSRYIGGDKGLALWWLGVEVQPHKESSCPEGYRIDGPLGYLDVGKVPLARAVAGDASTRGEAKYHADKTGDEQYFS